MKVQVLGKRRTTAEDKARLAELYPGNDPDSFKNIRARSWGEEDITLLVVQAEDEGTSIDKAIADKAIEALYHADATFAAFLDDFSAGTERPFPRMKAGKPLGSIAYCYARSSGISTVEV